jgi:hypothetical protein
MIVKGRAADIIRSLLCSASDPRQERTVEVSKLTERSTKEMPSFTAVREIVMLFFRAA